MRKYAKIDANQPDIVAALTRAGCSVLSLASLGNGAPDLLVWVWGRLVDGKLKPAHLVLMEVKDGSRKPSEQLLTPDEMRFHSAWRGPIAIVHSVEEALEAIK
jgi:hypothetical protein